jgi:hypothetical protein
MRVKLMNAAEATVVVVGDRASFEAAARGATAGGITAATGGADEADMPRLDQDVSAFTHEHALARFSTDQTGVSRARPRAVHASLHVIALLDCC